MPAPNYEQGDKTLAFLKSHRLPPTPQNYTLAYVALYDSGSPIALAIKAITDEGFRIKQEEVDTIFERHGGLAIFGLQERDNVSLTTQLRHQTLKISELTSSAADATGTFARELSEEAESLSGDGSNAITIMSKMVEHSLRAQTKLTAAVEEVKTLREELEAARNDAQRDELTGLANRRAIDALLAELAEKGEPRVIALCDIDKFKSVNDRYGHSVGDRVIKLVAKTLEESCAPHFVGRWGGEEFIVILRSRDFKGAAKLLDAARFELASKEFKLRETDQPMGLISFSGGVALATGGADANRATLKAADDALYEAKSAGRNQVICKEEF